MLGRSQVYPTWCSEAVRLEHCNTRYRPIFLSSRYVFLNFVVYASLILDTLPFMQAKILVQLIAPDKATKQSRDLKCVYVCINLHSYHRSPD